MQATQDVTTDDGALAAFRAALRHPTLAGSQYDAKAFADLHADLQAHFPRLFQTCERVDLGSDALLLRWPGADPDAEPVVLMAHQDVVPVDPADAWTHPPFDAIDADGVLWGRGTLDCKGSLVAICVAVERLIRRGTTPACDVWLSFGADEEVMGGDASAAVDALIRRDVSPWFVLDEGGAVAPDAFPGIDVPLAVIGVAEKGVSDVTLTATGDGGHASTPRRGGATAMLARAVLAVDRRPAPARLGAPMVAMLDAVAQVAPAPMALVLRHASRGGRPLAQLFARLGPETAAMVRTTSAVTMLSGSAASNVIATTATATVNLRIAVGDTVDTAVEHLQTTVGRDVRVEVVHGSDPSPVAPTDHPAYTLIGEVIRAVLPDAHPVPYVMNQATDARHFHRVWPNVYRFTPFRMTRQQRASLHNVDEHITVASWLDAVRWYGRLLELL